VQAAMEYLTKSQSNFRAKVDSSTLNTSHFEALREQEISVKLTQTQQNIDSLLKNTYHLKNTFTILI
jgi:hypothetical protein